jgi:hypothetical protein
MLSLRSADALAVAVCLAAVVLHCWNHLLSVAAWRTVARTRTRSRPPPPPTHTHTHKHTNTDTRTHTLAWTQRHRHHVQHRSNQPTHTLAHSHLLAHARSRHTHDLGTRNDTISLLRLQRLNATVITYSTAPNCTELQHCCVDFQCVIPSLFVISLTDHVYNHVSDHVVPSLLVPNLSIQAAWRLSCLGSFPRCNTVCFATCD